MPKSRLRKNHKQKVQSYKKRTEDEKKSFQRRMQAMFDKQQQEALAQQMANGEVQHEEVEGLNIEDFQLDDDVEIKMDIPDIESVGIVQGVTSPDQL